MIAKTSRSGKGNGNRKVKKLQEKNGLIKHVCLLKNDQKGFLALQFGPVCI